MAEKTILGRKTQLDQRALSLAIVNAMKMWTDLQYGRFLAQSKAGSLDRKWFKWFVGAWSVARTVKRKKIESVRRYFDNDFRQKIAAGYGATAVDDAAQFIQRRRWSPRKRKPLSLVAKIGFFLDRNEIVPYDRYSLRGLNKLRGTRGTGGEGHCKGKTYREYLAAFDAKYADMEEKIVVALSARWVIAVASRIGCSRKALDSRRMKRKVFDNYLMQIGGR